MCMRVRTEEAVGGGVDNCNVMFVQPGLDDFQIYWLFSNRSLTRPTYIRANKTYLFFGNSLGSESYIRTSNNLYPPSTLSLPPTRTDSRKTQIHIHDWTDKHAELQNNKREGFSLDKE